MPSISAQWTPAHTPPLHSRMKSCPLVCARHAHHRFPITPHWVLSGQCGGTMTREGRLTRQPEVRRRLSVPHLPSHSRLRRRGKRAGSPGRGQRVFDDGVVRDASTWTPLTRLPSERIPPRWWRERTGRRSSSAVSGTRSCRGHGSRGVLKRDGCGVSVALAH